MSLSYKEYKKSKKEKKKLTQDEIEKQLDDYIEVKDLNTVPMGAHIKYFKKDNIGDDKYRVGGFLMHKKGLPSYIVLTNGKINWSVQVDDNKFYRRLTMDEVKADYEQCIDYLELKINKLKLRIKALEKELNKAGIKKY